MRKQTFDIWNFFFLLTRSHGFCKDSLPRWTSGTETGAQIRSGGANTCKFFFLLNVCQVWQKKKSCAWAQSTLKWFKQNIDFIFHPQIKKKGLLPADENQHSAFELNLLWTLISKVSHLYSRVSASVRFWVSCGREEDNIQPLGVSL